MKKTCKAFAVACAIMISCTSLHVWATAEQPDDGANEAKVSGMGEESSSENLEEDSISGSEAEEEGSSESLDIEEEDGEDVSAAEEGSSTESSDGEEGSSTDNPDIEENDAAVSDTKEENDTAVSDAGEENAAGTSAGGEEPGREMADGEDSIFSLQIPQKIGIVLDPWEMDGRGQIYSEEYTIRNSGKTAGTLTLSFQCRTGENSNVVVRADKAGLHDDEDKAIYMELSIGEAKVALRQENFEYVTELEPGEELTICFTGELNENASESWRSGDVEVDGFYSWYTHSIGEVASADEAEESVVMPEADGVDQEPAIGESNLPETVETEEASNDSRQGIDGLVMPDPDNKDMDEPDIMK